MYAIRSYYDNVLKGYEPRGTAVLVQNNGDLEFILLHFIKKRCHHFTRNNFV